MVCAGGPTSCSSSSWYLFYMFSTSYRRSTRVQVSNFVMLKTGNYWLWTQGRQAGNTSAVVAKSQQEVERGFSEWRRITEVWVLSAIIRVVQGELTLPSLTLSCRQTSVRPPCQARLACSAPRQLENLQLIHCTLSVSVRFPVSYFPRMPQTLASGVLSAEP